MRRGCVTAMTRPPSHQPASYRYWGTCVDFPEPVWPCKAGKASGGNGSADKAQTNNAPPRNNRCFSLCRAARYRDDDGFVRLDGIQDFAAVLENRKKLSLLPDAELCARVVDHDTEAWGSQTRREGEQDNLTVRLRERASVPWPPSSASSRSAAMSTPGPIVPM